MSTNKEDLLEAAAGWRKAAEYEPNPFMKQTCERAAQALEIQHRTGVAVCTCCHKPLTVDDYGRRIPNCDNHQE